MNILIVGEFSGFARHLKNGFKLLGHEVTIVQGGDGWKKLANDDDIICKNKTWAFKGRPIRGSNRVAALFTNYRVSRQLKRKCPNPSIIIVINYTFLRKNFTGAGISIGYLNHCIRKGAKLIMSECGQSCAEAYFRPQLLRLFMKSRPVKDKRYTFLLMNSHVIIPTAFHYYEQLDAYSSFLNYDVAKLHRAVPLPITIDSVVNMHPIKERKVVIFHGIIRPLEKGTPYIKEAMDRLQEEMPERVECICKGGMPYDEYVQIFEKVDILVDQTYCNGWGVNATIAAMKGKCVLVSCGSENGENMDIPNIPFVQIEPDSNQIYQTLRDLVLEPERIDEIKEQSRRFVEEYCDCKIVAQRYIESVMNPKNNRSSTITD